MDVRCPKCQTLYELDETQVKSPVVTLKCSQCHHLFRFESRSRVIQENQRRWMIRGRSGDILYLNAFDILHQWIMEGKVTGDDEISRTGKKWVRLEDVGEFMPVFQVVASINSITGDRKEVTPAPAPAPAPVPVPKTDAEPDRERIRTSIQYGVQTTEDVTKRVGPTPPAPRPKQPTPAPAMRSEPTPAPAMVSEPTPTPRAPADVTWEMGDAPSIAEDFPVQSRSIWPFVALIFVLIGGAGAYIYFEKPELLASMTGEPETNRVVSIGAPDAAEVEPEPVEPTIAPQDVIVQALATASEAKGAAEGQRFAAVVDALRPGMDQALGVATEESEAWAEGSAVKEILADANRKLEGGRHSAALKLYKSVLEQEPRNVKAVTGIGWTYVAESRSADAVKQFNRALSISSSYGDALVGLGTAERQRGNLKAAYDAYDRYLGRHPKGPKASIARYQMQQLSKQLGM